MGAKNLFLFLAGLIALLGGFAFAYSESTQTMLVNMPFTMVVLGFFLGGIVFFGYLNFVLPALFGLQLGSDKNAALFLYLVPCALALYAGILLGTSLENDFKRKDNFFKSAKNAFVLLIIALVFAFAIEQALPMIINLWPSDLMGGMSISEGHSTTSMLKSLTALIR